MAERAPKRCSYPSRQRRQGPAPLASFEDLSDEIESPTEKNSHPMPEIEEELKLHADAATPSTPRVLETSPVTPSADLSSVSTPRVDSFVQSWEEGATTGGSGEFSQDGSRESVVEAAAQVVSFQACNGKSTLNGTNIKNSKSSSFMDDVRGAEAASALASLLPERSATPECLPQAAPVKKSSLTSGHQSGQSSRTPSRTPSPNSPRRFFSFFKHRDESSEPGSPASPKSPRKTSFTNLFKIGGRSDDRSTSPTSRKGSLSIFFKGGKDGSKLKKTPEEQPGELSSKGKKEASNRSVFSTLFRKDRKGDKKAPVKLTLQASSVDVPVELDAGDGWTSREISLHSHLCDLLDDDGEPLEGTEIVSETQERTQPVVSNGKLEQPVEVHVDAMLGETPTDESDTTNGRKQQNEQLTDAESAVAAAVAAQERRSRRPLDRVDAVSGEDVEQALNKGESEAHVTTDDRISSGSEQESDFDPVSLKKRPMSEDYEAETLIDEEVDYDDFPPTHSLPIDSVVSTKKPLVTPVRRQRLVDMTTIPIERPRSSTPLSITSLEAYIQTASPPLERAASDADKLKVSLPGDEFAIRGRSPRKVPVKKWQDFCQEVLQSPRIRRKEEEETMTLRGVVCNLTAVSSSPSTRSWVTFENVPEAAEKGVDVVSANTANLQFEQQNNFRRSGFSPSPEDIPVSAAILAEDCKCECHKLHQSKPTPSPSDASAQTTTSMLWARDRSTQMPSQDSTTSEPQRSTTIDSTSSGELLCHLDSIDARDALINHGSQSDDLDHDTTGEFTDAHTCSQHSQSASFEQCHVLFPKND